MGKDGGDDDEGTAGQGDGGGGGGDGHVDGGGHLTAEERQSIVEEILEALRGSGDGGAGGAGELGDTPPAGGRLIDDERWWEERVRRILKDVQSRETTDADLASLREEVKKIVERPPKKYRKITSALWGGGDDE